MDARTSTTKFEVDRFDGKMNFGLWQTRVKDALTSQGLLEAIEGIEKKPADVKEEDWLQMDRKALSTIRYCLTDEVLYHVLEQDKEITTAEGLWNFLTKSYQRKTPIGKLWLKQEFYGMRLAEGGNLQEHVNRFNQALVKLKNVGVKIEDEDKAVILLNSLPLSYEHFRLTLLYGKETVKYEEIKIALLQNEERRQMISSDSGLFANPQARGRATDRVDGKKHARSKSRKGRQVICYHCKEKGHFRNQCEKYKEKLKQKEKDQGNMVVASEDEADVLTVHDSPIVDDVWIMDSGCSYHMSPSKKWFDTYTPYSGGKVLMGNDAACQVVGVGAVKIKMFDGCVRTLTNVRHVPDLKKNLISLGALDELGCTYTASGGVMKVTKGALVLMKGKKVGNLYYLEGATVSGGAAISSSSNDDGDDTTNLWHVRLGHMSERGMVELHKKNLLKGLKTCKLNFCKYCVLGKQHRVKFSSSTTKSKQILDYIHSDVWGPSPVASRGGALYFVTFIDDFSRKVWVYFLQRKDEVFQKFKEWKAMVERQTGKSVKALRTDNGGEYTSKEFSDYCKKEGIMRQFTVPRTPQQNGLAERMNRTLLERARSMRLFSGLPK